VTRPFRPHRACGEGILPLSAAILAAAPPSPCPIPFRRPQPVWPRPVHIHDSTRSPKLPIIGRRRSLQRHAHQPLPAALMASAQLVGATTSFSSGRDTPPSMPVNPAITAASTVRNEDRERSKLSRSFGRVGGILPPPTNLGPRSFTAYASVRAPRAPARSADSASARYRTRPAAADYGVVMPRAMSAVISLAILPKVGPAVVAGPAALRRQKTSGRLACSAKKVGRFAPAINAREG
jgi:hypothetical protein